MKTIRSKPTTTNNVIYVVMIITMSIISGVSLYIGITQKDIRASLVSITNAYLNCTFVRTLINHNYTITFEDLSFKIQTSLYIRKKPKHVKYLDIHRIQLITTAGKYNSKSDTLKMHTSYGKVYISIYEITSRERDDIKRILKNKTGLDIEKKTGILLW